MGEWETEKGGDESRKDKDGEMNGVRLADKEVKRSARGRQIEKDTKGEIGRAIEGEIHPMSCIAGVIDTDDAPLKPLPVRKCA
jgi:hypothetical protein